MQDAKKQEMQLQNVKTKDRHQSVHTIYYPRNNKTL